MPFVLNERTCSRTGSIASECNCGCRRGNFTTNELEMFAVYNDKWSVEARQRLHEHAPEDFAGPNQTFPIRDAEDVEHASRLYGHADDPAAVRRKIIGIAKRKGLTHALPDDWQTHNSQLSFPQLDNEDTLTPIPGAENLGHPSKRAAQATLAARGHGADTTDASWHALKALRRAKNGRLDLAAKSHANAMDEHLDLANKSKLNGDKQGAVLHRGAADLHNHAMAACASGMTYNQKAALETDFPTLNLSSAASPRLLAALGLTANDTERHSFDGAPVHAGSQQVGGRGVQSEYPPDDDDTDDDFDRLRMGSGDTSTDHMDAHEMLAVELADDQIARDNRHRQGLDVPDPGMERYYGGAYPAYHKAPMTGNALTLNTPAGSVHGVPADSNFCPPVMNVIAATTALTFPCRPDNLIVHNDTGTDLSSWGSGCINQLADERRAEMVANAKQNGTDETLRQLGQLFR